MICLLAQAASNIALPWHYVFFEIYKAELKGGSKMEYKRSNHASSKANSEEQSKEFLLHSLQ